CRAPIAQLPVVVPVVRTALGLFGRHAAAAHERLDLQAIRTGRQFGVRGVGQEAYLAHPGLPAVAEQERARGPAVLGLVAVVVVDAAGDLASGLVERHPRAQVDGAAEAALDDLGRGVLVDVDAGHQFGRDFLEADAAAAARAE